MHAYEDNSSLPPSFQHPRTSTIAIADYGKLTAALAGFDGTAQPGSTLPIVYGEFGVESKIPPARRRSTPAPSPPRRSRSTSRRRRTYYHDALALAFCQPNVKSFFLFHAFDEPALSALAVGGVLRGRHREDEPAGGAQGDPRRHGRRHHPLPRPAADAAGESIAYPSGKALAKRAADAHGHVRHRLRRLRALSRSSPRSRRRSRSARICRPAYRRSSSSRPATSHPGRTGSPYG